MRSEPLHFISRTCPWINLLGELRTIVFILSNSLKNIDCIFCLDNSSEILTLSAVKLKQTHDSCTLTHRYKPTYDERSK